MKIACSLAGVLGLLLCGCAAGEGSSAFSEKTARSDMAASAAAPHVQTEALTVNQVVARPAPAPRLATWAPQRQVIRKAELSVRVKNVEKAEKEVGKIVNESGGYIDSASSTDLASDSPKLSMTLRVPVSSFEQSIGSFEALGVRLSKKVNSEDVTGQLVDLEARLKTLQAQEQTYREMLKQRRQLSDVLEMQEKLTEIRGQIESMAAQRKALSGLAALSTITLSLEQEIEVSQLPSDPNWLQQTWAQATTSLGGVTRSGLVVLIWLGVFAPFWIPAVYLGRKAYNASLKRPSAPPVIRPEGI